MTSNALRGVILAAAFFGGLAQAAETPSHHARIAQALEALDEADAAGEGRALAVIAGFSPRPLGEGDDPLAELRLIYGLSDDAAGSPGRGATRGPQMRNAVLAPGETEDLPLSFLAGETAILTLQGSGGVALEVTGDAAGEVCAMNTSGAAVTCEWTPTVSEVFALTVRSEADEAVRYTILSN
ncbi:MAG: hypothetical protein V2I43_28545 [Parvularcula sp.]|nr:hypothetical protein [Parvularcula sp.]